MQPITADAEEVTKIGLGFATAEGMGGVLILVVNETPYIVEPDALHALAQGIVELLEAKPQ